MNRPRKLLAISLPAAAIAMALGVAAVEIWTRAAWNERKGTPGFFLSDPRRIQRLAPGYSGWFAGVPVAINRLGFRDDRDYRLAKAANTVRILVLGDSVTFGHGSIYAHTYPFLLEQRLHSWRPDVDWQVWNLGVPGYNTSQELANLLDVGPSFQPDLVVVGFFENDVVGNYPVGEATVAGRARSAVMSWLYRHLYSIELYKRVYLQLAWKLSGATSYRQRLVHVAEEEQLIANVAEVQDLKDQQLTPYDRFSESEVSSVTCPGGPVLKPDVIDAVRREPGYDDWLSAVRHFQKLHEDGLYAVTFFANIVPAPCLANDRFFDGGTAALNRYYMDLFEAGTPAVSIYDAFRHLRPSQMPLATGHALGNANAVKADVLFAHLRDRVFPSLGQDRTAALLRMPRAR